MAVLQLVGLFLLTLPFWWSGLDKLRHPAAALAENRALGLHPAGLIAAATIVVQIGAPILLIAGSGIWRVIAVAALAGFIGIATIIGHAFWNIASVRERTHARNAALANFGLIGGVLLAATTHQAG